MAQEILATENPIYKEFTPKRASSFPNRENCELSSESDYFSNIDFYIQPEQSVVNRIHGSIKCLLESQNPDNINSFCRISDHLSSILEGAAVDDIHVPGLFVGLARLCPHTWDIQNTLVVQADARMRQGLKYKQINYPLPLPGTIESGMLTPSMNFFLDDHINFSNMAIRVVFPGQAFCLDGPRKAWWGILTDYYFDNRLFKISDDGTFYTPVIPEKGITEFYKREFRMLGRIFGVTINHDVYPGKRLDPMTMHLLFNGGVSGYDIDEIIQKYEPVTLANWKKLLTDDAIFEAIKDDYTFDKLVPGGEGIPLTRDNREAFVQLSKVYKIAGAADLIREMRAGIQDGVTLSVFSSWTFEQLERRIFGLDKLTAEFVIKGIANAAYMIKQPIRREEMQWLFTILREMDEEHLRQFLFFVTGSRNPPVNANEKWITVQFEEQKHKYPRGHTCFNSIGFPAYTSKDEMKMYLVAAIENPERLRDGRH